MTDTHWHASTAPTQVHLPLIRPIVALLVHLNTAQFPLLALPIDLQGNKSAGISALAKCDRV